MRPTNHRFGYQQPAMMLPSGLPANSWMRARPFKVTTSPPPDLRNSPIRHSARQHHQLRLRRRRQPHLPRPKSTITPPNSNRTPASASSRPPIPTEPRFSTVTTALPISPRSLLHSVRLCIGGRLPDANPEGRPSDSLDRKRLINKRQRRPPGQGR